MENTQTLILETIMKPSGYLLVCFTLLCSNYSYAKVAKDDPSCHWVKVCDVKKHKKPVASDPVIITWETWEIPAVCPPPTTVFVPVAAAAGLLCPDKRFYVGAHLSLGLGLQDPYASGRVGIRFEIPAIYLGLDVGSLFQYGIYGNLLVYVYRGHRVRVHVLDPGFLVTGSPFKYISDSDIKRRVDLTLGVGVEVRLICHLDLIADWRVSVPDPGKLHDCNGQCDNGRSLSASRAVGNAFSESQLYIGLMVH